MCACVQKVGIQLKDLLVCVDDLLPSLPPSSHVEVYSSTNTNEQSDNVWLIYIVREAVNTRCVCTD